MELLNIFLYNIMQKRMKELQMGVRMTNFYEYPKNIQARHKIVIFVLIIA
jgi:hypothetical protein